MRKVTRIFAFAAALALGAVLAVPGQAAEKTHRIAFQVSANNPKVMNLVLNNVANVLAYYHNKGEKAQID